VSFILVEGLRDSIHWAGAWAQNGCERKLGVAASYEISPCPPESKVIPANYFDEHGYMENTNKMREVLPEFKPTTIKEYFKNAFNS